MLVLTRRIGEELVIDNEIRIVVLGTEGRRVRFGVIAPTSIRVDRAEVFERNRLAGKCVETASAEPVLVSSR